MPLVKTYGRQQAKSLKQNLWLSPEHDENVFSSPEISSGSPPSTERPRCVKPKGSNRSGGKSVLMVLDTNELNVKSGTLCENWVKSTSTKCTKRKERGWSKSICRGRRLIQENGTSFPIGKKEQIKKFSSTDSEGNLSTSSSNFTSGSSHDASADLFGNESDSNVVDPDVASPMDKKLRTAYPPKRILRSARKKVNYSSDKTLSRGGQRTGNSRCKKVDYTLFFDDGDDLVTDAAHKESTSAVSDSSIIIEYSNIDDSLDQSCENERSPAPTTHSLNSEEVNLSMRSSTSDLKCTEVSQVREVQVTLIKMNFHSKCSEESKSSNQREGVIDPNMNTCEDESEAKGNRVTTGEPLTYNSSPMSPFTNLKTSLGSSRDTRSEEGLAVVSTPPGNKCVSRLKAKSFRFELRQRLFRKGCRFVFVHKDSLTPTKNRKTGKIITAKEKVLKECGQEEVLAFGDFFTPAVVRKCIKIGEGVYGEVFRAELTKNNAVALKILPVEGDFDVNEEPQKTFEEILPEIVISKELSSLAHKRFNCCGNFISVNRVACIQGRYPKTLLNQWDKYNKRKGSENDRPDIFSEDQFFIVFEFADGGTDLEGLEQRNLMYSTWCMCECDTSYVCDNSTWESQTGLPLGRHMPRETHFGLSLFFRENPEKIARIKSGWTPHFQASLLDKCSDDWTGCYYRSWGPVIKCPLQRMLRSYPEAVSILQQVAGALAVAESEFNFEHRDLHWGNILVRRTEKDRIMFSINGEKFEVSSSGVEVSIIDFTLSRLERDGCTVFFDLSTDMTLFEGEGDYQFDIYRRMKNENKNEWESFNPHTNVLWLHYIADKLINHKQYPKGSNLSKLKTLRMFSRHLLSHSSAEDIVHDDDFLKL